MGPDQDLHEVVLRILTAARSRDGDHLDGIRDAVAAVLRARPHLAVTDARAIVDGIMGQQPLRSARPWPAAMAAPGRNGD